MTRPAGYSLLETLVAAALFAALAALAWGGLDSILRGRQVLAAKDGQLQALVRSVGRFERDLRQALPRPARRADGSREPALRGAPNMLVATVWRPNGGTDGATLERVAWSCADGRLGRQRWSVVDAAPGTPVSQAAGLAHAGCGFRYRDATGVMHAQWPPAGASETALPRTVELWLRLQDGAEYRRLLELPVALAEPAP